MLVNLRGLPASAIYLILSFVYGLATATIFTVNLLYQFEVAKLSPLQLVLVGTVLETTCFLCQVPTGVLADHFSRRMSIILGVVVIGVGFMIEGSFPVFWVIAASNIFYGVGATLMTGAEEAWLAAEIGEEQIGPTFLRASQMGLLGGILGALLSVALAGLRLNVPVITGGALLVLLGLFLSLTMNERHFQPTSAEDRPSWRGLGETFRTGTLAVGRSSLLLLILGIGLVYGLASEGIDRLRLAHLQSDFSLPPLGPFAPVVWFGLIAVASNLLVIGATGLVRRFLRPEHLRGGLILQMALYALSILSLLGFALASNFYLAVLSLWGLEIARGVLGPLYSAWLTRSAPAKVRATVISFAGQMDALGQIAGGPPIGFLATVSSLRIALALISVILAPVLLLYAAALHRRPEK